MGYNHNLPKRRERHWLIFVLYLMMIGFVVSGCNVAEKPEVYHVGILSGVDAFNTAADGFKAGLVELGYIEGENIIYDFQAASGNSEKMAQISEKFVADGVDLIFAITTGSTLAAKAATESTNIPVVFAVVGAPVESGVVDKLPQPGGNITGVNGLTRLLVGKRLEYWQQMAPDARRIWIPYNADYPLSPAILATMRETALLLEMELVEMPVATPADIVTELEGHAAEIASQIDLIFIMPDPTVQASASWESILAFAEEYNLPIVANNLSQVRSGGLFGYFSDSFEMGRQAASLADEIFQGADPGTTLIVSANPHLVINYQAADLLGLTIGEDLLDQATEIIR